MQVGPLAKGTQRLLSLATPNAQGFQNGRHTGAACLDKHSFLLKVFVFSLIWWESKL